MSLKTDARHGLSVLDASFGFADIGNGGAVPSVEIPANAVIVGGFIAVDTAFAGIDKVKVGDSLLANRYGNDLALGSVGKKDLVISGFLTKKTERLRLTFPSGTPTAGRARLHLWYSEVNRSDFTQGQ